MDFALSDEDAWLRESAVYPLGEIGVEQAIALLRRTLADEHDLPPGAIRAGADPPGPSG